MSRSFKNFTTITNSATATVAVPRTAAIYVKTAGVLEVGSENTGLINFGSVVARDLLELEITQVGSSNTAVLIALR